MSRLVSAGTWARLAIWMAWSPMLLGSPVQAAPAGGAQRGDCPRSRPSKVAVSRSGAREAQAADEAAAWLQRFDCEPSVEAVQEAAAAFAGATPGRAVSWRSRVRKAPWLPELRVRVLRGLEEDVLTNASGQTHAQSDDLTLEVQARWRFDRLVFDRNELAVSREAVQLEELRRERVAEVTRLYFARRRLQVELVLDPPRSVRDRVGRTLTLDELTSELDGLTGGFFRRALRREHAPKP